MVRVTDEAEGQLSDYDRLDAMIVDLAAELGLKVEREGWTRKTYSVFADDARAKRAELLVRVESFATTSGEIRLFDDRGLAFARALGERLEEAFEIEEARIVRARREA